MAGHGFPPFPRRALRTSQDAGAAFAVIALAALVVGLWPEPRCIEGGATGGRPFSHYSACNGADSTPPTADYSSAALVADAVFWGPIVFGLGYTLKRRAVLRRAESTQAAPPAPEPLKPPPWP